MHAISQYLGCAPPYENNCQYKDWIFLDCGKYILKANEHGTLEVQNNAHTFHWDILLNGPIQTQNHDKKYNQPLMFFK